MSRENMKLKNGDCILFHDKYMIYKMEGQRTIASTSPLNGGTRDDIDAVFNFDETPDCGGWCQMKAETYEGHLAITAEEIGLDSKTATGLSTTVQINNTVVLKEEYHGHEIVLICTAGVDVNAARAGDPSGYDEATVVPDLQKGTINVILSCDVALPPGSLSRAMITITEAKSAALQELVVGSCYSEHLATGSGTDGIVVISHPKSELKLSNTGAHSKLGEIIANLTKRAVKKALYLQTGLDSIRQLDVYQRLKRFNIDEMLLLLDDEITKSKSNVALSSLIAHLLDQMAWGVLEPPVVLDAAKGMLELEFEIKPTELSNSHKVKDYVIRGLIQYLIDKESVGDADAEVDEDPQKSINED